ncbi:Uncharacterized protein SCG7086_BD_00150 [Chlamydiales bacterium SCGC AG-110-P3]|nr:Uncharacterized protein SCG7086_BD_00150 [Chlamydiales bacterium SCGC AG-110-P3]
MIHPSSNSRPFQRFAAYSGLIILVAGWWIFSFHGRTSTPLPIAYNAPTALSFAREDLQDALKGNIGMMTTLVDRWGANAGLTESQSNEFQYLARTLSEGTDQEIAIERSRSRPATIVDHCNTPLSLVPPPRRFLPQTYLSASIMLAIADLEQIVALPHGMRLHRHIHSGERMDAITLDTDRTNAEAVYRMDPDIAFVAHYSNPATLETLRHQGIALCGIDKIDTLTDVMETVELVGTVINRPLKGRMLRLFIEAAMNAIDHETAEIPQQRVLYLNYYPPFSTPTARTLTAQMLERLKCRIALNEDRSQSGWRIVLDLEEIRRINPDCMIISCTDSAAMKHHLTTLPALSGISATKQGNIFFVDDTVQQCPCHQVALAYYDLAHAITSSTVIR